MNITRIITHNEYRAILKPSYRRELDRHLYKLSLVKNGKAIPEALGYLEFDLDVSDESVKRQIDMFYSYPNS